MGRADADSRRANGGVSAACTAREPQSSRRDVQETKRPATHGADRISSRRPSSYFNYFLSLGKEGPKLVRKQAVRHDGLRRLALGSGAAEASPVSDRGERRDRQREGKALSADSTRDNAAVRPPQPALQWRVRLSNNGSVRLQFHCTVIENSNRHTLNM